MSSIFRFSNHDITVSVIVTYLYIHSHIHVRQSVSIIHVCEPLHIAYLTCILGTYILTHSRYGVLLFWGTIGSEEWNLEHLRSHLYSSSGCNSESSLSKDVVITVFDFSRRSYFRELSLQLYSSGSVEDFQIDVLVCGLRYCIFLDVWTLWKVLASFCMYFIILCSEQVQISEES